MRIRANLADVFRATVNKPELSRTLRANRFIVFQGSKCAHGHNPYIIGLTEA
jgi:hypothetical protein